MSTEAARILIGLAAGFLQSSEAALATARQYDGLTARLEMIGGRCVSPKMYREVIDYRRGRSGHFTKTAMDHLKAATACVDGAEALMAATRPKP